MIEEYSPYFPVSAGDPPVHLSYREGTRAEGRAEKPYSQR